MDINKYVETICANARESSTEISCINQDVKNSILNNLIIEIEESRISYEEILDKTTKSIEKFIESTEADQEKNIQ